MPFGPRASQAGVVDIQPAAPVRPDDFWGEGSAAIHDVLQAPDASEADAVGSPARASSHGSGATPRVRPTLRGWLTPLGTGMYARASGAVRVVPVPHPTIPRMRRRSAGLVAGGLAALACLAIAFGMFVGVRRAPVVRRSAQTNLAIMASRGAGAPSLLVARSRQSLVSPALRLAAQRGRRVGHSVQRPVGPRSAVHLQPSQGTARAGYSGSTASPPPTYAAASAPPGPDMAASAASASGSGGGGSAGQAAGPQGPGAPFGPMHSG